MSIVASGGYDRIEAACAKFGERFPDAEVVIENDDYGPDDG